MFASAWRASRVSGGVRKLIDVFVIVSRARRREEYAYKPCEYGNEILRSPRLSQNDLRSFELIHRGGMTKLQKLNKMTKLPGPWTVRR